MFKATILAAGVAFALSGAAFAQSNNAGGNGGGNNSQQGGLVNVSLGDVILQQIANDINVDVSQIPVTVQVPIGIAANVCGVAANVLAQDTNTEGAECDATSSSEALTQVVQQQMGKTQQ